MPSIYDSGLLLLPVPLSLKADRMDLLNGLFRTLENRWRVFQLGSEQVLGWIQDRVCEEAWNSCSQITFACESKY